MSRRVPSRRSGEKQPGPEPSQKLTQYPHPLTDLLQHFQRTRELVLCVRGGHDGTDAGLAFRHGREGNTGGEDAFLEQLTAEVHGELAVTDDDGRDGSFAGGGVLSADVEAQSTEFFLEEACVGPELIH